MSELRYVIGDAAAPDGNGPMLIPHVVNDVGAWGSGFVVAVSRRWPGPEVSYRRERPALGEIQAVVVGIGMAVVNMCAQHGFPTRERPVAVDYDALTGCLDSLAELARELKASVHSPRFGSGIAGGDWTRIESLIQERVVDAGVDVTIYDLPKGGAP